VVNRQDYGWNTSGFKPSGGHYIDFLGWAFYSDIASLHPGVQMSTLANLMLGGKPAKN